ncbi:MAG: hypothetical protein P8I61_03410 [Opitutae bacterium]|jgi:hypothetical protein|nr:hypothetical protein [Opitutae bacterium]
MNLSDEQKSVVCQWVSEGESIARIQNLLKEQFSIGLTYMDVRFLVDDLGVTYKDSTEVANEAKNEDVDVEPGTEIPAEDINEASGVVVDVDAVIRPGSLVSGNVRFSDGVTLGWQLTSTGQLGLIPGDDPEYRPSNEDLQSFQTQLQDLLKDKGF